MSRSPAIADHPDRASIEIGLANSVPLRVLGARYGLTPTQLSRYRTDHMDEALIARLRVRGCRTDEEMAQLREVESKSTLDHLTWQRNRLYLVADRAAQIGNATEEIRAMSEAGKATERIAKLLGDLGAHITINNTQVNITAHPDYHRIRTAIARGLRRHPDAWADVFPELERLEAQPLPALEVPR